jgi:hypothetical protein
MTSGIVFFAMGVLLAFIAGFALGLAVASALALYGGGLFVRHLGELGTARSELLTRAVRPATVARPEARPVFRGFRAPPSRAPPGHGGAS